MKERGFAHFLMLVAVVMVLVVGLYYWKSIEDDKTSKQVCARVITSAKNSSGYCRTFRTPCDVPEGWRVVSNCVVSSPTPIPVDTSVWNLYKGDVFDFKYPSGWRYDLKNTTAKFFGVLTFMNVVEFDKVESVRQDPSGMLLGRIEMIYMTRPDYKNKTVDDFVSDNFEHAKPTTNDVMIGDLKIKRVNHLNCAWFKDCVDLVFKVGNTFFDIRPLVLETKEEDLRLIYTILETFDSPDLKGL